ncbi:MAG: ABC transporter ATP-binding protein [Candidatus Riflebacteria bacterium]|nr:ABC transporter ATP-binding protein [Candidatus Riflebacteria bacterium]
MKPIIEAHGISKKYCINNARSTYKTFRESVSSFFKFSQDRSEFWALKDISFSAMPGESIGIIGKNGVGKTTLLKILSRITPPTNGNAVIRGRVASLLEVGTGFHPELTGFENIFLNGSILGLSSREIKERLEDILAFAEIGNFLETPMKHYSTGMWARLAFSVAAHLEAEILLIDEVLSVGDSEFQLKSQGKMKSISEQGRTVLFVSHNMASIRKFCNKCILLNEGVIEKLGKPDEVIETYLAHKLSREVGFMEFNSENPEEKNKKVKIRRIELRNQESKITSNFNLKDDLYIHLYLEPHEKIRKVKIVVGISESDGNTVCTIFDSDSEFGLMDISKDSHVSLLIKDLRFYPGKYSISIELLSEIFHWKFEEYDVLEPPISFNMINNLVFNRILTRKDGLLYLTPEWKIHD